MGKIIWFNFGELHKNKTQILFSSGYKTYWYYHFERYIRNLLLRTFKLTVSKSKGGFANNPSMRQLGFSLNGSKANRNEAWVDAKNTLKEYIDQIFCHFSLYTTVTYLVTFYISIFAPCDFTYDTALSSHLWLYSTPFGSYLKNFIVYKAMNNFDSE